MQPIKKDELFRHLGDFLKSKGIELTDGSLTAPIQEGCNFLTDAINATHKTVEHTKNQVDEALDHLRQSIHEKTAPKTAASAEPSPTAGAQPPKAKTKRPANTRVKPPAFKAKKSRKKQ